MWYSRLIKTSEVIDLTDQFKQIGKKPAAENQEPQVLGERFPWSASGRISPEEAAMLQRIMNDPRPDDSDLEEEDTSESDMLGWKCAELADKYVATPEGPDKEAIYQEMLITTAQEFTLAGYRLWPEDPETASYVQDFIEAAEERK